MTEPTDGHIDPIDAPEPIEDQQPAPPAWSQEDEDEARAFGWKPSSEWQGEKGPGYIDSPKDFMARIERSRTFSTMKERMESLAAQAEEQNRKLAAMSEAAMKRQREEYERQLASVQAAQRKAAESADVEAYDALERRRVEMMRAPVDAPQPQQPQKDPDVETFRQANEWTQNPLIWQEAVQAVDFAIKSGIPLASTKEQIAYAERAIKQKYPHLFQQAQTETPRPTRPAPVDGGGIASARTSPQFNSLPAEAKSTFARFVKEGLYSDDETGRRQFFEEYNNA